MSTGLIHWIFCSSPRCSWSSFWPSGSSSDAISVTSTKHVWRWSTVGLLSPWLNAHRTTSPLARLCHWRVPSLQKHVQCQAGHLEIQQHPCVEEFDSQLDFFRVRIERERSTNDSFVRSEIRINRPSISMPFKDLIRRILSKSTNTK